MKRGFIIVLDSVGIGPTEDWQSYDCEPGDTICHVAAINQGIYLPYMAQLGLGNIRPIAGVAPNHVTLGQWGKAPLTTAGKDTTAGHWEMMGIILDAPFPTYPKGFPVDLISALEKALNTAILGTKPASGTVVIEEFGTEHLQTRAPIVYTSADSVVQIACHEDLYSPAELYSLCAKARKVCQGKHGVGRIIARPFKGSPGHFERTPHRKDFSLPPPLPNVIDALNQRGIPVTGVGKIEDIFARCGITASYPLKGNELCMAKTKELLHSGGEGFYFINLIDFDMHYGHRNDAKGYALALEEFDRKLGEILPLVGDEDLLIITADHGNDPTLAGTDHNREHVPILAYNPKLPGGGIGVRKTMADIGATIYHYLTGATFTTGESWLPKGE